MFPAPDLTRMSMTFGEWLVSTPAYRADELPQTRSPWWGETSRRPVFGADDTTHEIGE